jgi:hypothetical protein
MMTTPMDTKRRASVHMQGSSSIFILGSGRSLLELNQDQISYVNSSSFVLAFNKYILFYDKVGIIPTHYLLADYGRKAIFTFSKLLEAIEAPQFAKIKFIFSQDIISAAVNALGKDYVQSVLDARSFYLVKRNDWLKGGAWANNLNEPLFHFRGSLSGCINIATILKPGMNIKLLGVDLNDCSYFFSDELNDSSGKWLVFKESLIPNSDKHETVVEYHGVPGIDYAMPYIKSKVMEAGGNLYCSNQKSLLVQNNLVEYRSVFDQENRF